MRAKGKKESNGIPSISMDFIFLGYYNYPAKKNAILMVYDNEADAIWAYRTGRKRAPAWLVPAILQDLAEAVYSKSKLCFISAQENVVKSIKDRIIAESEADSVPMESPAKGSKCNGRMERAVQTLEGRVRTLMMDLQIKSGYKVHPRDLAYLCLIQWACTILTRYRLTACRKTPFQILTSRQCNRPVAGFATPVLWKQSLEDHEKKKGSTDWSTGLFMGVRWRTAEAIVATIDRIVMCRKNQRDEDNANVTEEMLKSIPESAIEALYSKKDEEGEQDGEEPDKSEQEDEDEVADIFGEFSDDEPENIKTTSHSTGGQEEFRARDDDAQDKQQKTESDGDSSETRSWINDGLLNSVNVDPEHRRIQEETWEAALQANKQRTLENNIRLSNMIRRADVTEVYSQPRIAKACMESGLTEGSSLVLGTGSDLSIPKQQKMAI